MDDAIYGRVRGEDAVELVLLGHVGLVEGRPLPADQFDAVEGDLGRIVEAVDNDDVVAILEEGQHGEGSDITRATIEFCQPAVVLCQYFRVRGLPCD